MDRNMQTIYSKALRKCITSYSEDTTVQVLELLENPDTLIRIEKILQTNPTEQEFSEAVRGL